MSDLPAEPNPPVPCPFHPFCPALLPCARCGALVCDVCAADSPEGETVCPPCTASHRFSALKRAGVHLDLGECLEQTWAAFRERWDLLVAGALLLLVLQLVALLPSAGLELGSAAAHARGLPGLALALKAARLAADLLSAYLTVALALGYTEVWLRLLRRQPLEFGHLFGGFRNALAGLAATFLTLLAALAGALAFLVGLFVVATALAFVHHLIVDRDLGPLRALAASWELTRDARWPLFLLLLVSLALILLGALACCVGIVPASAFASGLLGVAYTRLAWPGNRYLRR